MNIMYIVINSEIYMVFENLFSFNKELFDKYSKEVDGFNYFIVDLIKLSGNYDDYKNFFDILSMHIGGLVMYDEATDDLKKFNKLGSLLRTNDDMAKLHHLKGNDELAFKCIDKAVLELVKFSDEMLKEEETAKKNR